VILGFKEPARRKIKGGGIGGFGYWAIPRARETGRKSFGGGDCGGKQE